jgi:hypothetical protein
MVVVGEGRRGSHAPERYKKGLFVISSPFSRRILAQAMLLLVAGSIVQLAQADTASNDALVARTLFDEGRSLMGAGNHALACPKFAESMRLNPGGGTLLNLALCHETVGRMATAWLEYKDALAMARRDGRPEREKFALEHINALEPRLSQLTVQVDEEARVPGLELKLDGTQLGQASWGVELPVDGGEHRVEASAPGKKAWAQTVDVAAEADRKTLTVPELEAEGLVVAPPTSVDSPRPARMLSVRDLGPEPVPEGDNLSHDGQLGLFLRGDIEGKGRGAVAVPGVTYGVGRYIDAGAGALRGLGGNGSGGPADHG